MRVVISGMGVISALGLDREGFWQSLAGGQSGIGPIPEDVGPVPEMGMSQVRFKNGAAVLGYDPETYFARKTLSFMDRCPRGGDHGRNRMDRRAARERGGHHRFLYGRQIYRRNRLLGTLPPWQAS